jgi:hypothetical protein
MPPEPEGDDGSLELRQRAGESAAGGKLLLPQPFASHRRLFSCGPTSQQVSGDRPQQGTHHRDDRRIACGPANKWAECRRPVSCPFRRVRGRRPAGSPRPDGRRPLPRRPRPGGRREDAAAARGGGGGRVAGVGGVPGLAGVEAAGDPRLAAPRQHRPGGAGDLVAAAVQPRCRVWTVWVAGRRLRRSRGRAGRAAGDVHGRHPPRRTPVLLRRSGAAWTVHHRGPRAARGHPRGRRVRPGRRVDRPRRGTSPTLPGDLTAGHAAHRRSRPSARSARRRLTPGPARPPGPRCRRGAAGRIGGGDRPGHSGRTRNPEHHRVHRRAAARPSRRPRGADRGAGDRGVDRGVHRPHRTRRDHRRRGPPSDRQWPALRHRPQPNSPV